MANIGHFKIVKVGHDVSKKVVYLQIDDIHNPNFGAKYQISIFWVKSSLLGTMTLYVARKSKSKNAQNWYYGAQAVVKCQAPSKF